MAMSDKIEHVYKVLEEHFWRDDREGSDDGQRLYIRTGAMLVIEAMREPTNEMLEAAAPFPTHLVVERNDVDYTKNMEAATTAERMAARSKYQTMIDAALSPADKTGGGA
jgi:hypothetical protein